MRIPLKCSVVMALVLSVLQASADPHQTPGSTSLGSTTLSGGVAGGLSYSPTPSVIQMNSRWSGVAGQVWLVNTWLWDVSAPSIQSIKTTLSVYVQIGRGSFFLGNIQTANDGTFLVPLLPGTYIITPAAFTPYAGLGQMQVTVIPRHIAVTELNLLRDLNDFDGTFSESANSGMTGFMLSAGPD